MRVYVLHFHGAASLSEAFSLLMESDRVESCVAEPDLSRIRFRAEAPVAEPLVEALYARGGLAWCSRHRLTPARASEAAETARTSPA